MHTLNERYKMENEIRHYIKLMLEEFNDPTSNFKPSYIVTAVKLPTGAIELAVNTERIKEKLEYILCAYDEDMRLKTNNSIQMQNIMVV